MKNLRVALLILMIPFVFFGCKKDDPETLLTAKPWRLCGYEFIPGITIAGYYYTDYYTPYVDSDCIYDELIEFTDDGRIITREGSVVCIGAEQPSKNDGSWYFNDDQSFLYVNVDYHVNIFHYQITMNELTPIEINKDRLVLEGVFAPDTSIRYRVTFEHP